MGAGGDSASTSSASGSVNHIVEVWAHNLEEEMDRIRDLAESYPYIAMVWCPLYLCLMHESCRIPNSPV